MSFEPEIPSAALRGGGSSATESQRAGSVGGVRRGLIRIGAGSLACNSFLNFIGQVIPLIVALVTIPYIVNRLGPERFGIYSIAVVCVAYLSAFDFGLGRATTKFIAQALGKGEQEKTYPLLCTSLVCILVLSMMATGILLALTPTLVSRILKIEPGLTDQAKSVFYIISISIPITALNANLMGVLQAYQQFGLLNAIRIPFSSLTYVIPAVALLFNASLPQIVALLTAKNFVMLLFYFFCSMRLTRPRGARLRIDLESAPALFGFGVWIALGNATVMMLMRLDVFFLAALVSMSAVTYYTVPYQLVNRAIIVPSSIMTVLFPAFSSLEAVDPEKLQRLFVRSFKYLLLVMGFAMATVVVFARDIMQIWLGAEFAARSSLILQILAVGVLLSSLAWLAGTLLQSVGKPRIVTIIHICQLPLHVFTLWLLIPLMDARGAALSWTIRLAITLGLLLFVCHRTGLFKPAVLAHNGSLVLLLGLTVVSSLAMLVKSIVPFSIISRVAVGLIFLLCSVVPVCLWGMDSQDKSLILGAVTDFFRKKDKKPV